MALLLQQCFIVLLFIVVVHGEEELQGIRICKGRKNEDVGRFTNSDRFLKSTYMNCTHVKYSLIITDVTPDQDISFLSSIVEVYGSVIIKWNNISLIPLTNLKVIRGMSDLVSNYSLFMFMSSMNPGPNSAQGIVDLRSLRSIANGRVFLHNIRNFPFLRKVNWTSLFEQSNAKMLQDITFGEVTSVSDVSCDNSCDIFHGKRSCWGSGSDMCQKISSTKGCHNRCIGGCNGSSQFDCVACKHYKNGRECVNECPRKKVYNDLDRTDEDNPDYRYKYIYFCVKKCPKFSYKFEDAKGFLQCRADCPKHYTAKGNECVKCDGDCLTGDCRLDYDYLEKRIPKDELDLIIKKNSEKKEIKRLTRTVINSLAGCTSITGNLKINDLSTNGQDELEWIRERDLKSLSNVRKIHGDVHLQLKYSLGNVTSLSFLSKLETVASESTFFVFAQRLTHIGLVNLKTFKVPKLQINASQLCYLENTTALFKLPSNKMNITAMSDEDCKKHNKTCDEECNSFGCWGPGPEMCIQCKTFKAGNTCIKACHSKPGYYYSGNNTTCEKCHPQCKKTCSGPEDDQCIGGCKYGEDNQRCVSTCPNEKFLNRTTGICEHCSSECSHEGGNRICTGPNDIPGLGGCTLCEFIRIPRGKGETFKCFHKSREGYFVNQTVHVFPEISNYTNKFTKFLSPCHGFCKTCDVKSTLCRSCNDGFLSFESKCLAKCPDSYFSSEFNSDNFTNTPTCLRCHRECKNCYGPTEFDCQSCKNKTIYLGEKGTEDESKFYCNSTCPPEKPYSVASSKQEFVCRRTKDVITILLISLPIIFIILIISIVLIIVATLYYRKYQSRYEFRRETLRAKYTRKCVDDIQIIETENRPDDSKLKIISNNHLIKGDLIGSGAFGSVFKGVWMPPKEENDGLEIELKVAIKELKPTNSRTNSEEFLSEAYVMASVDHVYCMHLLGVSLASPLKLISEHMPLGNLRHYVLDHKDEIGSLKMFRWALHIAEGMEYLGSRGIIHRDLAARNVLLDEDEVVRITDFGLAKFTDNSEGFEDRASKLPVRWLAIECIRSATFSTKSDVWAYGVTLWEIFSFGESPYQDCPARELLHLLESGERLPQPKICTLSTYMLLIKCWLFDTESRPTFAELIKEIKNMATDPGRYLIIQNDQFRKEPIHALPSTSAASSMVATSPMSDELSDGYEAVKSQGSSQNDNCGPATTMDLTNLNRQISKPYDMMSEKVQRMKSLEEEDDVFAQEYEIPLQCNPSGYQNCPETAVKLPTVGRETHDYVNTQGKERFTVHNNEYGSVNNDYQSVAQTPVNEGCTLSWDGDGEYLVADVHSYQNVHPDPVV